jgi:hypothetical protein
MSEKIKAILHYFDARGLAEIVRLSMATSGIQVVINQKDL